MSYFSLLVCSALFWPSCSSFTSALQLIRSASVVLSCCDLSGSGWARPDPIQQARAEVSGFVDGCMGTKGIILSKGNFRRGVTDLKPSKQKKPTSLNVAILDLAASAWTAEAARQSVLTATLRKGRQVSFLSSESPLS